MTIQLRLIVQEPMAFFFKWMSTSGVCGKQNMCSLWKPFS